MTTTLAPPASRHGLTEAEYGLIVEAIGREPNAVELGMFGAMWSEHCSYKNSRALLRRLPTGGDRVVVGPGENAGAIEIGDGLAAVFKVESHNHPSAVEPYQGAATGVGGILRDIFTMGARPIALLNSLRFGPIDPDPTTDPATDPATAARNRYLFGGVVAGIAGYGNCIGVPDVGGEIFFDASYSGNPLVNAMCIGIAPVERLMLARASGVGNPLLLVGARTGRDGIQGASFASATLGEDREERRPAVQVGNPFLEKLLMEACLELLATDAVVAMQDLGAAGLTCALSELSSRGDAGCDVDLDAVPRREDGMTPYEVLLSESQERMLLVAREAQNRVGGRIYTLRSFAPGLYAEAGAMRIPRAHDLTLRYCEQFGLPLRPFMMGNPKALVHIGGVRMTAEEANREHDRLPFQLTDTERGRTADDLWSEAISDLRTMVESDPESAWNEIVRDYDQYSLYEFLRARGWSEGAIEYFAVMNFLESDMHQAFVEILREELGGAYVDMQEIPGGMDRLPNAFYAELEREVRLGAEVFAVDQDANSVTVHYKTEAGRFQAHGDFAIVTLPFSVLRSVEMVQPLSREKQRAIRQLNYHASTKILFQVRRRLWEIEDGIRGGGTVTDLPVRRMNYPTPDPATERGVLLASYTWGQDALQWGAMDDETRLEEALDDVARIHPWIRDEFEVGASHAWYGDRWARGAFAMFAPEQQTRLQADIVAPEGRLYFAGEHCSLYHAWIQGALESGIRAAREIHETPVRETVASTAAWRL